MARLASIVASGGEDGSQLFILTQRGSGKPRWKVCEFSIESINAVQQIQGQGAIQVVVDYLRAIGDKAANNLKPSRCSCKKLYPTPNRVGWVVSPG